ncbi:MULTISPECIES: hypothetical protein [unclassified Paenibacillus]|uniref:hypothetical protein n=1 Tax=unclassified Paenibacillus TaxID=185978 RepID=UPI0012E335B6|nr:MULTISPECIES: hypothetical protein [unclassified Paenibacillus]
MTAWRSSHSTYAQYAMPNKWFEEIGLNSYLQFTKNSIPNGESDWRAGCDDPHFRICERPLHLRMGLLD